MTASWSRFLAGCLALLACQGTERPPDTRPTTAAAPPAPREEQALHDKFHEVLAKPAVGEVAAQGLLSAVERSNSASFEVWQALEPRDNHVVSPYGIRSALALVYLGLSPGAARSALQSRLHYPARNADLDVRLLHGVVRAADQTSFGSVSALWVNRKHVLSQAYLDAVSRSLMAEVHSIDFAAEPQRAGRMIAAWGSEHTRGQIPNIVEDGALHDSTRPVLTDLAYLSWHSPPSVDPNYGAFSRPFSTSRSTTVDAQTTLCAPCLGFVRGDYQVGVATYPGTTLRFVAIMPKRWSEFRWNKDTYRRVQASMANLRLAELELPRLRLRSRENLSAVMNKLDLDLRDSRFQRGMLASNEPLGLVALIHETSVQINETSLTFEPSPHLSTQLFGKRLFLRFDRPFYFLLIEPETALILLMGQVTDPTA